MTQFDEMMRTQDALVRSERESVCKGLVEAMRLVRRPTDRPDCDKREIYARLLAANDFLGRQA